MYASIKNYCTELLKEFSTISPERKLLLEKIAVYINSKSSAHKPVNLVYICTHNSRRSHFGQIWAKVASEYYNIPNMHTFSGGTEATAFNIHAINALKRVGFNIRPVNIEKNALYHVFYDDQQTPVECFSKVYDDPKNPQSEFAAIMTCGDAEENCPFIPGVELRIGTTYDDPKVFDNTPWQDEKYDERCRQIALETLYVFSKTK
ncbi:MAG: protein-tyrosine-phosphatase [Bacteroidetes bacterium]|jgi:protein-tyrosine phosphatase/arsenate reductase|nr:protein-tyrosine-phosphatase [Bacteroidota bacterium]